MIALNPAKLNEDIQGLSIHIYCHVSGGVVFGSAEWRSNIFHHHLCQVL